MRLAEWLLYAGYFHLKPEERGEMPEGLMAVNIRKLNNKLVVFIEYV